MELYSLKTESDYVRSRLAQFGSDLVSVGIDGFRLDAAKRECFHSCILISPYRYSCGIVQTSRSPI